MKKFIVVIGLMTLACQKSEVSSGPVPDKNFAHPEIIGTWTMDKVQTINCGASGGTNYYPSNDYRYFSNYISDNGWYYCDQQHMDKASQQFKIIGDSIYYRYPSGEYHYNFYLKRSNDSLIFIEEIGISIQHNKSYHCSDISFAYKK